LLLTSRDKPVANGPYNIFQIEALDVGKDEAKLLRFKGDINRNAALAA
jgi:hypothetical protein